MLQLLKTLVALMSSKSLLFPKVCNVYDYAMFSQNFVTEGQTKNATRQANDQETFKISVRKVLFKQVVSLVRFLCFFVKYSLSLLCIDAVCNYRSVFFRERRTR